LNSLLFLMRKEVRGGWARDGQILRGRTYGSGNPRGRSKRAKRGFRGREIGRENNRRSVKRKGV